MDAVSKRNSTTKTKTSAKKRSRLKLKLYIVLTATCSLHVAFLLFVVYDPRLWKVITSSTRTSSIHTIRPNEIQTQRASRNKNNGRDGWSSLSSSSVAVFSACLMFFDENHRLPEWLAYHYYTLNLRHLIILSDPRSQTSPMEIAERWKNIMEILLWTDGDIGLAKDLWPNRLYDKHKKRQKMFYRACATYWKKQQQKQNTKLWTALIDVDEFIYLDLNKLPATIRHITQQPGNVPLYLDMIRRYPPNKVMLFPSSSSSSSSLLSSPNQTSQEMMVARRNALANTTCFQITRTLFSAVEQPPEKWALVQKQVPPFLNASHFDTLRFMHFHTEKDGNFDVKSIVDPQNAPSLNFQGIHKVLPNDCWGLPPLRIRHYLGSWQAITSRVDVRAGGGKRCLEGYEYYSQLGKDRPPDDALCGWLMGFAKLVSASIANNDNATANSSVINQTLLVQQLLHGAGQVVPSSSSTSSTTISWHMLPHNFRHEMRFAKTLPFPKWLQTRYHLVTLKNGTEIVAPIPSIQQSNSTTLAVKM